VSPPRASEGLRGSKSRVLYSMLHSSPCLHADAPERASDELAADSLRLSASSTSLVTSEQLQLAVKPLELIPYTLSSVSHPVEPHSAGRFALTARRTVARLSNRSSRAAHPLDPHSSRLSPHLAFCSPAARRGSSFNRHQQAPQRLEQQRSAQVQVQARAVELGVCR